MAKRDYYEILAVERTATAEEICVLAPQAELVLTWKTPDVIPETVRRVREFLNRAVPA